MKEIWKPIKNYEGIYEISNKGRVKSLLGKNSRTDSVGGIFKNKVHKKGYFFVSLSKKNNQKSFKTHRLVAQAFVKNDKEYPQVNHKNGIKTDNVSTNLEWCTGLQNMRHSISKGLWKCFGENNFFHKLTNSDIEKIRFLRNVKKIEGTILGKMFKISACNIYQISNYKAWKHLP